jgi:hypothetical protein
MSQFDSTSSLWHVLHVHLILDQVKMGFFLSGDIMKLSKSNESKFAIWRGHVPAAVGIVFSSLLLFTPDAWSQMFQYTGVRDLSVKLDVPGVGGANTASAFVTFRPGERYSPGDLAYLDRIYHQNFAGYENYLAKLGAKPSRTSGSSARQVQAPQATSRQSIYKYQYIGPENATIHHPRKGMIIGHRNLRVDQEFFDSLPRESRGRFKLLGAAALVITAVGANASSNTVAPASVRANSEGAPQPIGLERSNIGRTTDESDLDSIVESAESTRNVRPRFTAK